MRVNFRNSNVYKFQDGGAMPVDGQAPEEMGPEAGAPMEQEGTPQGGEDPLMQIAQMAVQAIQTQDCNAAMQVCEAFIQLIQQAQGGGAPQEGPAGPPEGTEPVYAKGGKLVGYQRF